MIKYFKDCTSLDEAKKLYWTLAKIHHPDKGGDEETFKEILNQFEAFKPFKEKFTGEQDKWNSAEYVNILNELIKVPEVIVEICGSWIWVSGNTKPYKELIKKIDAGESYRRGFSKTKEMWYFSPTGYRKKGRSELDIHEIRNLYGSKDVQKEERETIDSIPF